MKHRLAAAIAAWTVTAGLMTAGELRLKTRTIATAEETGLLPRLSSTKAATRRMDAGRSHWLLSIESDAVPVLAELTRRGARVLSHLPPTGYLISAGDETNWEGLSLAYRGLIAPEDKLSPLLSERLELAEALAVTLDGTRSGESAADPNSPLLVLARFHKDVEAWQADGILDAEGLLPFPHASLEPTDRLLQVRREDLERLQLWDEVEYLFPAPAAMKDGEAFFVCGGVFSQPEFSGAELEISLLAATYGPGWDGPGRGRAELTYSFGALGASTDPASLKNEARRALEEWSRIVAVTFRETPQRHSPRSLDILFATGEHGDPYPFLAGSRTLAHAFYPAPPNAEPLAGDVHVNSAFAWTVGGTWDVYSVLLHEIGHSLGIGHTDAPGTVMYPYYQIATHLKSEDIASIRQLYADSGSAPAPAPAPAPTPLFSLAVASPTEGASTALAQMNFSGSLSTAASSSRPRVEYRNESSGAAGACLVNSTGITWSCAAVPLAPGDNRIAVTALQGQQTSVARRMVTRQADSDVALSITSPAAARPSTTAASLTFSGSAQHASGLAQVRWSTLGGSSGTATLHGSSSLNGSAWSATIPLTLGPNEITFRATARSGVSASRTLTADRLAASSPTPPTPANPAGDRTAPQMTIQTPVGSFIFTSAARITFRGSATDNLGVTRVSWKNSAGGQSGDAITSPKASGLEWSFDVNLLTGFNSIEIKAWDAAGNASAYSATVRRY